MSPAEAAERGKLAASLVPTATRLVGRVRDESSDTIGEMLDSLDRQQLYGLAVVLAAMVDDERTPGELLGWVTWDEHGRNLDPAPPPQPRQLKSHGTHSAFNRHRAAGEEPCKACWEAERTYQLTWTRRKRRTAKEAA